MARKNLLKSESAAAIAIAAVLLLGLAFTVIAVVKLNYAPEWKIDAEKEYSYDAWSSMEDVKTRGEIFTRFMESDINYPYGLSATVPFNMGGGDVPVFEPYKSNSKLTVNTQRCTMNIVFNNHSFNETCGGITYYSENRQYPDQIFRYENGALILAQGNNSQMKRDPLFNITEYMGNYTVTINAINLTGEPESISSSTLTSLRLTGCSVDPVLNSDDYNESVDSFNLSISTHYTDAWTTYFNNTAKDAGLEYGTDYNITYPEAGCVCISFLPAASNNYSIHFNKTVLCAELGRRSEGFLPSAGGNVTSGNVMKKGIWYTFELSDNGTSIVPLKDFESDTDFSTDGSSKDKKYNNYNPLNSYSHNLNSIYYETFRFNNFTEFESNVTKITVRIIYRSDVNPSPTPSFSNSLKVSNNYLDKLDPDSYNKNKWYLFSETKNISVNYPSEIVLSINIGPTSGSNQFYIDYLAVRLD